MEGHPPILRQLSPPTDEAIAAGTSAAEQHRAEYAARTELLRPSKRAVLASGPELRDLDAAVDCGCACHPRPADPDLHDGGRTCNCQLTPDERRTLWDELVADWAEEGQSCDGGSDARSLAFAAAAQALNVTASVVVGAAPFVISGVCGGRGFYLRERHGHWRVTIATDANAGADPWTLDVYDPTIDIAAGSEEVFHDDAGCFSEVVALSVAVDAVRTALKRSSCPHDTPEGPDRPYCGRCGVVLADEGRWRLPQ